MLSMPADKKQGRSKHDQNAGSRIELSKREQHTSASFRNETTPPPQASGSLCTEMRFGKDVELFTKSVDNPKTKT
jgi:hypothetical protein